MEYDVIVIGAGISGLTAAALLSKRGLKICVVEEQYKPGGACGIFKRDDNILEQGASMMYGFGETGFCPHRFVFNALEEPIDMIKHNELYAINYGEHKIIFYYDIDKFIDELVKVFPRERKNFEKFYGDMSKLYKSVIAETPVFMSPDAVPRDIGMKQLKSHPLYYMKFLSYMNCNTEKLLRKYFKDKEVLKFFDKLTSTYCYTTVEETPAVLSSIMFVDNHFGGSYYPAGSTLNFVGKLEKVIEEHGGDMVYNTEVTRIIVENNKAVGIETKNGVIKGKNIVYSGNVWNLYGRLLGDKADEKKKKWAESLVPTFTSVVLFAVVKEEAIPKGTLPIEMIIGNKDEIDDGEITVYIFSIDDKTIAGPGYHVVEAIGPTFKEWPVLDKDYRDLDAYKKFKAEEQERVLNVLEGRFPGFKEKTVYSEIATPCSLVRYVHKYKGATAGPKQKLGQHMLKRLHTRSEIEGLYNCGESTVMGTGTPAVTVSGISAANLLLRDMGLEEYRYSSGMKDYVTLVRPPYTNKETIKGIDEDENKMIAMAGKCQFCENPKCETRCPNSVRIRDVNRRLAAGNIKGAKKALAKMNLCEGCKVVSCEEDCIRNKIDTSVSIQKINTTLYNSGK